MVPALGCRCSHNADRCDSQILFHFIEMYMGVTVRGHGHSLPSGVESISVALAIRVERAEVANCTSGRFHLISI